MQYYVKLIKKKNYVDVLVVNKQIAYYNIFSKQRKVFS